MAKDPTRAQLHSNRHFSDKMHNFSIETDGKVVDTGDVLAPEKKKSEIDNYFVFGTIRLRVRTCKKCLN